MYEVLRDLLDGAIAVVLKSRCPHSGPNRESRRTWAKRLLETYERLEIVLVTASELRSSATYYRDSHWSSHVAKRMRQNKLVSTARRLQEQIAELGEVLFTHLHHVEGRTRLRDSMNYLMGIRPMGRGDFMGARPWLLESMFVVPNRMKNFSLPWSYALPRNLFSNPRITGKNSGISLTATRQPSRSCVRCSWKTRKPPERFFSRLMAPSAT